MQVEVTVLTRRGAAVMRRSTVVTADSVRFGRGTGNEVPLADIRVELQAATLYQRDGGLFIERSGTVPLHVRGQQTNAAEVRPGDEILIGPFRLTMTPPSAGSDAALSVELVQPMGDALQRLLGDSRIGLQRTTLNKRVASWSLFVIFALLCLAAPIAAYSVGKVATLQNPPPARGLLRFINLSWNPGELSNTHRFFAEDCATCHREAFARVPDDACLACHSGIGSHVAATAATVIGPFHQALDNTRCTDCHVEHRGARGLIIQNPALCTDCHRALSEQAPQAEVRDVIDFPKGHPQFRVTVVADAAQQRFVRKPVDASPPPVDHPNLNFSHAAHLVENGFPVLGYKPLVCNDCHVAEPSGQNFLPITYKGQCQRCHELNFDVGLPWKTVPHGDDKIVVQTVHDFYAGQVLQRGIPQSTPPGSERQVPGAPAAAPAEPQRDDARAWVDRKTKAALDIVFFDAKRGCAYCHTTERGGDTLKVQPVILRSRFLPAANFDHSKHSAMLCGDCHDARHAETSGQVLIPGIQNCVKCHGAADAELKAASTCTSCHDFHREQFGPMRSAASVK
jgi:predicted CXXCH cytochrome family protein